MATSREGHDVVRVELASGAKVTVGRELAEARGWKVIAEPAVDSKGVIREPEYPAKKAAPAPKKEGK